jgi:hypothetical protein
LRNLLAFLLALILGGALYFALSRRMPGTTPAPTESPAAPASVDATPSVEKAKDAPASQPLPLQKTPGRTGKTAELPPLPTALAGTVVVLDEQGGEHATESGILALALGPTGARAHHDVEVRDGRWSLALVPTAAGEPRPSLGLQTCVLGKRLAVPATGQEELALPADGKLALRLRWSAAPKLHVRARDTESELADVSLYELPTTQRGTPLDAQHPGPEAKGRAAGQSPITLADDESSALGTPRVVFAKSPGYAWGRIEVDPRGAEPALALDPAGALELAVVGEPALTSLEVLLREADSHAEVLDQRRGDTKTFRLEDLHAGRYTAEARHYGTLAGSVAFEVVAGQRVQAVLEVARPAAASVPFEGLFTVPAEYATQDFLLEFLLQGRFDEGSLTKDSFEIRRAEMTLEPATPGPGAPQRYRWHAAAARPARYRMQLTLTPHFLAEVDTGPSGTQLAQVEVPRPAHVALRCLDEETGAEVQDEKPTVVWLSPSGSRSAPSAGGRGSVEFDFLQGRALIFTTGATRPAAARVVELGPGPNEILLPLKRKP